MSQFWRYSDNVVQTVVDKFRHYDSAAILVIFENTFLLGNRTGREIIKERSELGRRILWKGDVDFETPIDVSFLPDFCPCHRKVLHQCSSLHPIHKVITKCRIFIVD